MKEDEQKKAAINTELDKINATLRDARDVKRKNDHEARIEEAISALKRYFPGVKGRLVRLCQPTMKRYDLAVTVAGGKDMVRMDTFIYYHFSIIVYLTLFSVLRTRS